jgi:hypothetical protein
MIDALPPHHTFDHASDLKDGTDPPWVPIYALSLLELKGHYEYSDTMLKMSQIW